MRSIFKLLSAISILAATMATSAFADSMCYDLCVSCQGTTRAANCDKIESTCNCPFVVDSAKSKNMGVEMGKRKLIEEISANCDKPVCVRTLTFENGLYKSMEKGRTNLTRLEIITRKDDAEQRAAKMQPQAIVAANETVDSLTRRRSLLPIPPMTMECNSKCDACFGQKVSATPVDSSTQVAKTDSAAAPADTAAAVADSAVVDSAAIAKARADSIARADSLQNAMCLLTERTCQCKAHADNTRELVELDKVIAVKTAYADSILKFRDKFLREDMARVLADSVQVRCHVDGKCRYTVTYTSKELALLEMHPYEDVPEAATLKPAEPTDTADKNDTPVTAAASPAEAAPAPAACPQAAPADTSEKDKKDKGDRIFYKVMEFVYGNYRESNYYTEDYGRVGPLEDETGYEAGLSYYLRWYFYDGGAFSIGLGTFYHYKKFNYDTGYEDGISIYYHNIGADVPISFRLGVPKIPIFKPFISETFNFHKPIFEIYKIDGIEREEEEEEELSADMSAEEAAKQFIHLGVLDGVQTRFNGLNEFTFSVWLGFGLQITRHFSVEYQINFGTVYNGHAHDMESDDYWRIVVDFAW